MTSSLFLLFCFLDTCKHIPLFFYFCFLDKHAFENETAFLQMKHADLYTIELRVRNNKREHKLLTYEKRHFQLRIA